MSPLSWSTSIPIGNAYGLHMAARTIAAWPIWCTMLSQRCHGEGSVATCAASRGDVAIQFPSVGRTVRRLLLRVTTVCLGSRTQVVPIDLCFFEAHCCPSLGACGVLHGQQPLFRSAMMRARHDNVLGHWEVPLFFFFRQYASDTRSCVF